MAETGPKAPESFSSASPEVQQQAEQQRELYGRINDGLNAGNTYTPRELDEFVQQAEALGGLWRPDGEEGPADLRFPGGRLEGTNTQWQTLLERIEGAKEAQVPIEVAANPDLFVLDDSLPEAQRQPLLYINRKVQEMIDRGILKTETGRTARADGLFVGNAVAETSPAIDPQLTAFRVAAGELVSDLAERQFNDRLGRVTTELQRAEAVLAEFKDLMSRGMVDLDEVKSGRPPKTTYFPKAVSDPRARELSPIYLKVVTDYLDDPANATTKADFETALQKLKPSETASLRTQGDRNRLDLFSGRDAEKARQARAKIDAVNAEAENQAAWASYAPNVDATQTRERAEAEARENAGRAATRMREAMRLGLNPLAATDEQVRNAAQVEAYANDPSIYEQMELEARLNARIAQVEATIRRTPDGRMQTEMRKQITMLEEQRTKAMKEFKERQDNIRTEGASFAAEALVASHDRRSTADTIHADDENFDAVATTRRTAMGLEPVPFREQRRGNVVEAYFMAPGNNNLVVMERYDRRTGALLSQSTWTTEDGLTRDGRGRIVPPNEVVNQIDQTSARDEGLRAGRARGRAAYGGVAAMDGVYASYGATPAQRGRLQGPGGIVRYFLGGGNRHTT